MFIKDLLQQAIVQHQAGNLPQAENLYRQVLKTAPQTPDALHLLGVLAFQNGNHQAARELIERAIKLKHRPSNYLNSLSQVLLALQDDRSLIDVYQKLLKYEKPSFEIFLKQGQAYGRLRQFKQAEKALKQAQRLEPDNGWAANSLGNLRQMLGDYPQAEIYYQQALKLGLNSPEVLNNLGIALHEQARFDEALAIWKQALNLDSQHAESHMNAGMSQLLQGNWEDGMNQYEPWRWKLRDREKRRFLEQIPLWQGQPLTNQTLLIHTEQGFGDTLQFIRLVPQIKQKVAHLIVECQPELLSLLQQSYPGLNLISQNQALPHFDYQIPLLSLPWVLKQSPNAEAIPYLQARPEPTPLLPDTLSPKIGIAWSSRGQAAPQSLPFQQKKSLALKQLAPWLELPRLHWFSLQVGIDALPPVQPAYPLEDLAPQLTDFQATADAISQLDLVITVDTAVAHLAGAMNKPVWVLLPYVPDWRWELKREDSLWYPSMQLFRQPQIGDWESVVQQIKLALERYSAS